MSRIDRPALVSILGEVASMMIHDARWAVEGSDEESRFWMRHEAFNGLAEAVELWAVQGREDGLPSEEQEQFRTPAETRSTSQKTKRRAWTATRRR